MMDEETLRLYEEAIDRNGTLSGDDVRGVIAAVRTLDAERVRLRDDAVRVLDAFTALVKAMGAERRKMATGGRCCHFPTARPRRPMMYLPCPIRECDAVVELDFEEVSNGDGPWLQTYTVPYVVTTAGPDERPACEQGCLLTPEQVAHLEADAFDDYVSTDAD